MGKKITINDMLTKFPRKNKYTPRKDMYITRENTYIIKNDLFGIKPVKITMECMLSKSPRKNKYIAKNDRFGIKSVCAVLAGVFAVGCIASTYMNPMNIQKIYSQSIEGRVVDTGINFSQEVMEIQDNIKSKRLKKSKLTIPDDIPDYLSEAIAEHADFRLTEAEEKIMAKWDPLLEYFSTLDIFNKGHYTDPIYMKATVAVESRGYPKACSPFEAKGLFQIRYSRAKAYARRLLENQNINLGKIARDIENLGYDASYINKENLKPFRDEYLYNPAMSTLMFVVGDYINHCRFGNRIDLKLAEWNAGLSKGIIGKRVTNIKETMDYIARNNALYKRWHNQKRGNI